MRLLNIRKCKFELWPDPREVHYAILSHTWEYQEMVYRDLCAVLAQFNENPPQARDKFLTTDLLSDKLRNFFQIASRDGFDLVWVDTCCIDKSDRSELVEAMNSMFDWYGFASACYVYLNDIRAPGSPFRPSRWFRRMWTLQELIAPRIVLFFTVDWRLLGSKHTLFSILENVTGVDSKVLTSQTLLDDIPVAQRITWASRRECTRFEDAAYSLMGLLGVNMQITYGEGRHAFFRLQVEVLRRYPDQTILAFAHWHTEGIPDFFRSSLRRHLKFLDTSSCKNSFSLRLAHSPEEFVITQSRLANLSPLHFAQRLGIPPSQRHYPTFNLVPDSPVTIHMNLPVVRVPDLGPCAVLSCKDSASGALVIPVVKLRVEASIVIPKPSSKSPECPSPSCQFRCREHVILPKLLDPPTRPIYVTPGDTSIKQRAFTGRPQEFKFIWGCHRRLRRHNPYFAPILLTSSPSEAPPIDGPSDENHPHTNMRLLKVESGEFREIDDSELPDMRPAYAILSHVWSKTELGEQTYQNVRDALQQKHAAGTLMHKLEGSSALGSRSSALSHLCEKLRRFCIIASEDGKLEFGWADTCCIDKTNPKEVEYAIPEMFNWYAQSKACYVFLHDVESINWQETFSDSEWFKRGWTLQELLAPRKVIFFTSDWVKIGTKDDTNIQELIGTRATRIPSTVLTGQLRLPKVPLAQRFSWVAERKTTRVEDLAYSMMDIVGVKIPVAYGEGLYAFIRLQEEALKRDPDQTVFAWGRFLQPDIALSPTNNTTSGPAMRSPPSSQFMLALSPQEFRQSSALRRVPQHEFASMLGINQTKALPETFEFTPNGIRVRLPLLEASAAGGFPFRTEPHSGWHTHLALLSVDRCADSGERQVVALLLRPYTERGGPPEFLVGAHAPSDDSERGEFARSRLYTRATFLSMEQLQQFSSKWVMTTIYIPHYPPRAIIDLEYNADIHDIFRQPPADQFEVCLCKWSARLLELQGFEFAFDGPSLQDRYHVLTISTRRGNRRGFKSFRIVVGRCGCDNSANLGLLAVRFENQASQPAQAAEQSPARHDINHEDHVSSWSFSRGVASKLVEATSPWLDSRETRLLFNLTLTTAKFRALNNPPTEGTRTYFLGVEIHDPALLH